MIWFDLIGRKLQMGIDLIGRWLGMGVASASLGEQRTEDGSGAVYQSQSLWKLIPDYLMCSDCGY